MTMASLALLCSSNNIICTRFWVSSFSQTQHRSQLLQRRRASVNFGAQHKASSRFPPLVCLAAPREEKEAVVEEEEEDDDSRRRLLQILLWGAEGIYIFWLFLLPYAPGDPVWAISSDTLNSLIGLSLNFFFILPVMNSGEKICSVYHMLLSFAPLTSKRKPQNSESVFVCHFSDVSILDHLRNVFFGRVVGIHLINSPVLHPMSEGLFNFVLGWTFMFAPLLFTDNKRDRYKGSLDVLWGFQMFLTNTFLIPYMAIRLNDEEAESFARKPSRLGSVMINGAPVVGLIGGAVCLISAIWALYGRQDSNFGSVADRWEFLVSYLGSERLAYAFIWDICLYIVFQPWLIGDNLQNVQKSKVGFVRYLRFVPVIGLIAYLLFLNRDEEP